MNDQHRHAQREEQIRLLVCRERKLLPRVGGRKLYWLLQDEFHQQGIVCGRDKLFKVLRCNNLLIKPRKRYIQTTMSKHWMRKYPNLLKEQTPSAPEQVWVSDITYVKTTEGYCYLSLITDAYSRKIVGYNVSDSLEAANARRALQMAVRSRRTQTPLIHHSDRGYQYCSSEYIDFATRHNIRMSMTEHSDPYENALAERMNRTLKEEFGLGLELSSKHQVVLAVEQAVELYNTYRPHLALQGMTPHEIHKNPQ